jgi:hypothetical protein
VSLLRGEEGSLRVRIGAQAIALIFAMAAACSPGGASPTASTVDSGISGRVLLGPTCPVEQAGQSPCVTPYSAVLVVTDAEDREVARTTAAQDGTFRIALAPGDYVVVPQPGDPFPQAQPLDVTVVPGSFADIEINYDTGIR